MWVKETTVEQFRRAFLFQLLFFMCFYPSEKVLDVWVTVVTCRLNYTSIWMGRLGIALFLIYHGNNF